MHVNLIPLLRDNYAAVLHDGQRAVVVDPAEAPAVVAWLEARGLELQAVLQTHHHSDHIGGTPELLRRWPGAEVMAAAADRQRIPFQTHGLEDGDQRQVLGRPLEVLAVPGHTRAHLAFYLPPHGPDPGELFCGDTLFIAGCGRLFERTAEQMHRSLQRLAALPADTRVWCAHEYTESNLRWAAALAPQQEAIQQRLVQVQTLRQRQEPSLPSSLALEQATNLFLQARSADDLAALRSHKDHWTG